MKKNSLAAIGATVISLLLVLGCALYVAVSHADSKPKTISLQNIVDDTNPSAVPLSVDLTGVWVQTDGTQAENMTAQISHGEIQIVLQLNTRTATYWDGSFDYDQVQPGVTSFDVTSQSSHPLSIFASKLDSKKFSYKNGVLSYDFKIVGTDRTIELRKGGA